MPAPTPVVVGNAARGRDTQVPPYIHCGECVGVHGSADDPRRPPHRGGGEGHGLRPGVAPSADGAGDDKGFHPLRRAGVSLAAASGSFAPCEARPEALPLETAIWATRRRLARGVGEEFCVRARPSFVAILDVWQEAEPQLWRKRPGDARRHTGGKLPYRKNRVKLLTFCT